MLMDPQRKIDQESELWCGAACTQYILRALQRYRKERHSQQLIMSEIQTLGIVDWCGSTPAAIAKYLLRECTGRKEQLQIFRLKNENKYAGRLHIWALKHDLKGVYQKWNQAVPFTSDEVILRFVTPKESGLSSHFVVETHFENYSSPFQLMDPAPGEDVYVGRDFDEWLATKGADYQPTSLDLVIHG